MKKTKLISALSALCISLAVLAFGVFAVTTVTYNVNSTVSFIADGVYLHAVGNVQKGPLNGDITEDTSQTTYSYEDTNYTTKQDSLEPDGSTSAGSLDAWNVGVVSFDSLNNVIEFKVVFTNYSEFDIAITVDNSTVVSEGVEMQEDKVGLTQIANKKTGTYVLRLILNDQAQTVSIDIDVDIEAKQYKAESSPVPQEAYSLQTMTETQYAMYEQVFASFGSSQYMELLHVGEKYLHISEAYFRNTASTETLVIPSEVGGEKVKRLAPLFSMNLLNPTQFVSYTNVVIEDGIEYIDGAFALNPYIQSVTIPRTVTSAIGAFMQCSNLQTATIENGATNLSSLMFDGCSNLTTLNLPDSLISLSPRTDLQDWGDPLNWRNLTYSTYNGGKYLATATNPYAILLDQEQTATYSIHPDTKILSTHCLAGLQNIQSFDVPEGITAIERGAFADNYSLKSITIPASVTRIAGGLFSWIETLETITVHPNNPVYDSRDNCNAIIETASNTLVAGADPFSIPSTVTAIGSWAFHAWWMPGAGKNYAIPEGITKLGDYAFCEAGLIITSFPQSLETVGQMAFELGAGFADNIVIPKNVRKIGPGAFAGVVLKGIQVDPANKFYDSRNNCNAIIEKATNTLVASGILTKIPAGVKIIGLAGAALHYTLDPINGEFVVPEGVETIMDSGIMGWDYYGTLYLPSTLKFIGVNALYMHQSKPCTIYLAATVPPQLIGNQDFDSDVTIVVPKGSLSTYLSADVWSTLEANIVEQA